MRSGPPALLSIHDITPGHLSRVLEIVDVLETAGMPPATLLVVPGRRWAPGALDELRALVDRGYEVAGHGWSHQAPPPRDLYHRVHAVVLSRDQAEHLSRGRRELRDLVASCHAWFVEVGLPAPRLYVPPAWALGALTAEDLRALPFDWYESLRGFLAPRAGTRRTLPLVGYEADTVAREGGLRLWNALNRSVSRWTGRPVRVSIHPSDLSLRLAASLRAAVTDPRFDFVRTGAWLAGALPVPPEGCRPSQVVAPRRGSGPR